MSIWHLGEINDKKSSVKEIVDFLKESFGEKNICLKKEGIQDIEWTIDFEKKTSSDPFYQSTTDFLCVKNMRFYNIFTTFKEKERTTPLYTIIQSPNRMSLENDLVIEKILKHFGGKYKESDCSEDFIVIKKEVKRCWKKIQC